jgi:hypothetical protein
MLCEECQEREATVHVAVFSWPSGELSTHLCESCYPAAEAARARSYAVQPAAPAPIDVEHITATEYLQVAARAAANGADKPALKHISRELERFPVTRGRLGLELLRLAWQSLEQGNDPYDLILLGGCLGNSAQTQRPPEYAELLEKIVVRSFEALARLPNPPSAHPFGFGLTAAVRAFQRADPQRSATVIASLKDACGIETQEHMGIIIDCVEQRIAEADQKLQQRRRGSD